jgi:hypothetical protein
MHDRGTFEYVKGNIPVQNKTMSNVNDSVKSDRMPVKRITTAEIAISYGTLIKSKMENGGNQFFYML